MFFLAKVNADFKNQLANDLLQKRYLTYVSVYLLEFSKVMWTAFQTHVKNSRL